MMKKIMMKKIAILFLIAALLVAAVAPALAQQVCVASEDSMEQVFPGVTLTWGSSFWCENVPDSGAYTFTVQVTNSGSSSEGVTINSLALTHTTPRPRGQGPAATGEATGLPLSLAPGETGSFTVSGSYELVTTDEGKKANLHFQAAGVGTNSGTPFSLGLNAHLRGPGATEDGGGDDDNGGGGPPPWVPGPPPWAGQRP